MIDLTVTVDTKAATQFLNDVQRKQIPFATSVAINKTAGDVQEALTNEMSVFDRPKSVTKKGIYITRSTKSKLTATVGLKSRAAGSVPVAEYLGANIEGGGRVDKRSEIMLRNAGILPAGMQTRPGPDARLDAYGNMSRGQIVQILSYFRAFGSIAKSGRGRSGTTQSAKLNAPAKRNPKPYSYFVMSNVLWMRQGKKIKQMLTFTSAQSYRKRYDFKRVATSTVQRQFDVRFKQAMDYALATAR